jgi:hypothetical protein
MAFVKIQRRIYKLSDIINEYINSYLSPRLSKYRIDIEVISQIIFDIESRLKSVISRWNDLEFRNTILITGQVEAIFYEPEASLDIKELVVICIRNSLLEDMLSTDEVARKYGLRRSPIPEADVKIITGEAIEFFKGFNIDIISKDIQPVESDSYYELKNLYPVTWAVLHNLTQITGSYKKFEPIIASPLNLDYFQEYSTDHSVKYSSNASAIIVKSGIDPTVEYELIEMICRAKMIFFDSFKYLTRNIDKLFKVLEFVFRRGSDVITTNYYLSNGYVARRIPIIKPAHRVKEVECNIKNIEGLTKTHREGLKYVLDTLPKI